MGKKRVARHERREERGSSYSYNHYKPGSHHDKEKHPMPAGLRVLTAYMAILIIFYIIFLFVSVKFPTSLVLGQVVQGSNAIFLNMVVLIVLIFAIHGFYGREAWSYYLSMAWFIFGIINSVSTLTMMDTPQFMSARIMFLLSSAATILINLLIIWYLYSERDYFLKETYQRREKLKPKDKIFIYIMVCFWTLAILVTLTIGLDFYKDVTKKTDMIIKEISGRYNWEIEKICAEKKGSERDLCYVVYAGMKKSNGDANAFFVCHNVRSDFYRFTCFQLVQE